MNRFLIISMTLLIGGCGLGSDSASPVDGPDLSLPGVYSGTFPCGNCPGIDTTLWLKPDGRFFLRQRYLGNTDGDGLTTFNLGRWNSHASHYIIELRGDGPKRFYTRPEQDALILRNQSDLEYRLSREPNSSEFTATIALSGMTDISGDSASFTECLTGYAAPINRDGDFARFERHIRSLSARGEPAFVEFEGRFNWSGSGSLKSFAIERFKTVREGRIC